LNIYLFKICNNSLDYTEIKTFFNDREIENAKYCILNNKKYPSVNYFKNIFLNEVWKDEETGEINFWTQDFYLKLLYCEKKKEEKEEKEKKELNDNEKNENEEIEEEDNIDCKTLDENIRHIYLNYSPAPNSLRGTKTKNRQFIKRYINTDNYPKNKGKFIITNNKPSPRDFYYEPTLDENDKNTYQEIKEIKYCKCIIF
jgi:hypothetical protein